MTEELKCRPRPCDSCPYRRDVPSGVWANEEYMKLPLYDLPIHAQPVNLFLCHQTSASDEKSALCTGWVHTHGTELLALRLGFAQGTVHYDVLDDIANGYMGPPLYESGCEAADHGTREVESPSVEARMLVEKISQKRPDVRHG